MLSTSMMDCFSRQYPKWKLRFHSTWSPHHRVSVNRESVRGVTRDRYQTKSVTAIALNTDDSKRDSRAASIAPLAIDERRHRRWGSAIQRWSRPMIPVSQCDYSALVVHVIAIRCVSKFGAAEITVVPRSVRVKYIIYDHSTAEAIAILRPWHGRQLNSDH